MKCNSLMQFKNNKLKKKILFKFLFKYFINNYKGKGNSNSNYILLMLSRNENEMYS